MNDKKIYTLDKERLQQYNDMKPATKKVLGLTARVAVKMLKMIVKAALLIPGMVRKLAASEHAGTDLSGANRSGSDCSGADRSGSDRPGADRSGSVRATEREKKS